MSTPLHELDSAIAVIGLAAHVPGARDIDQFWANLREGIESVDDLDENELRAAGISESLLRDPRYVRRCPALEGYEEFDPLFFGYTARDAARLDPQQRLFLQCAHHALEHAGCDPTAGTGPIGVFAGAGPNTWMQHVTGGRFDRDSPEIHPLMIGNQSDFMATRVSYDLDLRGPAATVLCGCSTSLMAIHVACQSLLLGECRMALAGGCSFRVPYRVGYLALEHMSTDGHCRAFDARASGTLFGGGAGVVVLKPLADALADGDTVHAVIRASAAANDGRNKVGFTAPSVEGQERVITEALELAEVEPDSITYVEAHGTGTRLGDPIEVEALTRAFCRGTDRRGFCGLGSLKTNIGHLEAAAGVAGLIKVVLALEHRELPASLNFESPNPAIDFAASPFYVNDRLRPWDAGAHPRRAGVSSLGIGGTNIHVVLEEAPLLPPPEPPTRPWLLLPLSARTEPALTRSRANLAEFLRSQPEVALADVAHTLARGRRALEYRAVALAADPACARAPQAADRAPLAALLEQPAAGSRRCDRTDRPVAFLFPGQGAQKVGMARSVHDEEPVFRRAVEECAELCRRLAGIDLLATLYPEAGHQAAAERSMSRLLVMQLAVFTVEHALGELWESWGVRPVAMLGHSLGEYAAACRAGVLTLEDALRMVVARCRALESMPPGANVVVPLPEAEVTPLLSTGLSVAAVNTPSLCVVSGPTEEVVAFTERLQGQGVQARALHIPVAAHSGLIEPFLPEFRRTISSIRFREPRLPYISCTTGDWISAAEVNDPEYWVRHLRHTVRFSDGAGRLLEDPTRVLLEVGPGIALSAAVRNHPAFGPAHMALSSLPHPTDPRPELPCLLETLGRLWVAGVRVDWSAIQSGGQRRRVPLPTYPFDRARYWLDPPAQLAAPSARGKRPDLADWFELPTWRRTVRPPQVEGPADGSGWLVLLDECGLGEELAAGLEAQGERVVRVRCGQAPGRPGPQAFDVRPAEPGDYQVLFDELAGIAGDGIPRRILHCASLGAMAETRRTGDASLPAGESTLEQELERGFYSLLYLVQALIRRPRSGPPTEICVVTGPLAEVVGGEALRPACATLLGPLRVLPREVHGLRLRCIDIPWNGEPQERSAWAARLLPEVQTQQTEPLVALRGEFRWTPDHESIRLPHTERPLVRAGGVYLITGGLGGVGLVLARRLAMRAAELKQPGQSPIRLVLTGRRELPPRSAWEALAAARPAGDELGDRLRRLLELELLGAEVIPEHADVAEASQMAHLLAKIRERCGPLHGVIHAAAAVQDGLAARLTRVEVEAVFDPKIRGTLNLDRLLAGERLDFFVLCSSLATHAGPPGQLGYAAANAFLECYAAQASRRGPTPVTAIAWDAWQEAGLLHRKFVSPSPPEEPTQARPPAGTAGRHPLLGECIPSGDAVAMFERRLSASGDWVLSEHRLRGQPLLVGTAYLELVYAALQQRAGAGVVELTNFLLLAPLFVEEGSTRIIRTTVEEHAGELTVTIRSSSDGDGSEGAGWQEHVRCTARTLAARVPARLDLTTLRQRCQARTLMLDAATRGQLVPAGFPVSFGPRWESLRTVWLGEDECLARIELPDAFVEDLERHCLHPALVDVSYPILALAEASKGTLRLPLRHDRVVVHGPLPKRLMSHSRIVGRRDDGRDLLLDVALADEQGLVLLELHGLLARAPRTEPLPAPPPRQPATDPLSGIVAEFLRDNLRAGLLDEEGAEAFERIVGTGQPQVLVCTRGFAEFRRSCDELVSRFREEAGQAPALGVSGPLHERPPVSTEYLAPRTPTEEALARLWQEALGYRNIGVHDNFFELGGQSLLAAALVARIGSELRGELTFSAFFEAPTIAGLARLLEPADARATATPLVRLREGADPPIILVHPADGQPFIFQHLIPRLPAGRALWAFDAFRLPTEPAATNSIEELARTYLDALPPLGEDAALVGFCMGGSIAYEMVLQLRDRGRPVPRLVLLDTFAPGLVTVPEGLLQRRPDWLRVLHLAQFLVIFGGLHELDMLGIWCELRHLDPQRGLVGILTDLAGLAEEQRIGALQRCLQRAAPGDGGLTDELVRRITGIFGALSDSALLYRPRPYDGPVVLLRAVERNEQTFAADPTGPEEWRIAAEYSGSLRAIAEQETLGWERHCLRLQVHPIPGDHFSAMRPPHVQQLATLLGHLL